VLTAAEVVQILDETVDWYRTLGAQQQSANQPSDLMILYANRQAADKVMDLALAIARANAELISSEADTAQSSDASSPTRVLAQTQAKLNAQRQDIQTEMEATRHRMTAAPAKDRAELQAKINELQGALDMVSARRNLLDTMADFTGESDSSSSRANALKAQIEAIAGSIPTLNAASVPATGQAAGAVPAPGRRGLWDLGSNVLRMRQKMSVIDAIDQRTAALEATFLQIRIPPLEQLKALTARGDQLAAEADASHGAALKAVRDQLDTTAWLFKQTSSILIPLSKESVLLKQYRHNLANWRVALQTQYHDALKTLAVRLGFLALLLSAVFVGAELWRRAVFRYAHEPRRRFQLLWVRKIVLWALVATIVGSAFASELGSLVTFAGLITAGLAVAMQSILVSLVGYFFLIGKYGIRVGDRVQIGTVTGEVIEIGLVRMHLMELNDHGLLGPTGRVVAFANSIVFQSSAGLFKQIPGVSIAWHDTTLKLPHGCDAGQVKDKLLHAVLTVVQEYHVDFERQNKEIQKTAGSSSIGESRPQVQLHFGVDEVEAHVSYPVQVQHAAEIDERVSRELSLVISRAAKGATGNS
jgi:small-conductance mechanosensitive channel